MADVDSHLPISEVSSVLVTSLKYTSYIVSAPLANLEPPKLDSWPTFWAAFNIFVCATFSKPELLQQQ